VAIPTFFALVFFLSPPVIESLIHDQSAIHSNFVGDRECEGEEQVDDLEDNTLMLQKLCFSGEQVRLIILENEAEATEFHPEISSPPPEA
jgi:hypothetical protein